MEWDHFLFKGLLKRCYAARLNGFNENLTDAWDEINAFEERDD